MDEREGGTRRIAHDRESRPRRRPVVAGPVALAAVLVLLVLGASRAQDPDPAVARRFAVLERNSKERRADRRDAAMEELLALGPEGEKVVIASADRHLERHREEFEKALRSTGSIGRHARDLHAELDRRRAEALRVIFDRSIYPDEDHGRVGQPAVDAAVAEVRSIWESPTGWVFENDPEVEALFDDVDRLLSFRERAGAAPLEELPDLGAWFERADASFPVEEWVDPKVLSYNREVVRYDQEGLFSVDPEERQVVIDLNAYRWMLGLRVLEIDERLVRCARDHSQEMEKLGYFAHDSPVPENDSPSKRARQRGYPSGVAENIATSGSGAEAHRAWYHSSGHHRNMLGGHVQIGVGRSGPLPGRWFTQNFGGAPSLRGKEVTDPELLLIGRRRTLDATDPAALADLADWCRKHDLLDAAKDYARAALAIDPDQAQARAVLGHKKVLGRWVEPGTDGGEC